MKLVSHIVTFILLFFFTGDVLAQSSSEISDVVNKYVKITSIEGISSVKVTSSVDFAPGDTVMIVQMKGAIYSSDDPNIIDFPANMGKYELTVIGSAEGTDINFNSPLKNTYNVSETVQLIRVPSYTDAVVKNKLTCAAWDGEKGGILALIASNCLTLNADIDVSGKGFRGGAPVYFATGKCFGTSGVPFERFNILNNTADSTSGIKGEGARTNQFVYTFGKGPSGNGGGAGTGAFAGGGGGGNSGIGGNGAKESCADDNDLSWGGNGGRIDAQYFSNSFFHRRIYLGGGGGSGIQKTPSSGTAGGNGGGIVILLTPYLITNGHNIKANGDDVAGLVEDGSSSGGGGGGGMVLLAVDSVENSLNISASGGNGGGIKLGNSCEGQGGGGGGGFVWFSGKSLDFEQLDISGGDAGNGSCDVSSTAGNAGDSLNRLLLPLTGFLNNTIKSLTKTCYSTSQTLKGSRPQGGNGIFTYQWQYRNYGSTSWLTAPGKNDTIDYKTILLTDTTQFRRIVSSDGMNDISRVVTINVFPQITNNIIDPDTVVCHGSASVKIRGSLAQGGIGNFNYEWSQRSFTGEWEPPTGIINTIDYLAPTDVSRYYRRKATSDYCSIYDSVKVEVLPVITENIVIPRQTICLGSVPEQFIGNNPVGGTGTYTYSWQQSDDSISWNNAGVSSRDFTNTTAITQTTYYRRIVSSGLSDCCRDTGKNIKIIVLPQIINNSISAPQTICEGSRPDLFNGSSPSGGDQNTGYRYQWEFSKDSVNWDSMQYSAAIREFHAAEQDSTHFFRRIIYSGLNDCCKSISNKIKISVQPKIKNNIITGDTSICENAVPKLISGKHSTFSGGDEVNYTSRWMQKTVTGTWQDIQVNEYSYQPPSLKDTIFYQRIISSGTCTDNSNIVKINVLRNIQGNEITGNHVVCDGFPADPLSSGSLSGGEPGVYRISWEKSLDESMWEIIDGETNAQLSPGILTGNTYFRRKVRSGPYDCCQTISNIFRITIDKNPEEPDAGMDKEVVYQDTTLLSAKLPVIGVGIWSTVSNVEISNPDNFKTQISGLKFGRYAFYWTVTNGVCPSVKDSVIINVSDLKKYTGFSPNGDGINDMFVVEGLDNAPTKDLTILNRWGVEVFHSSDYKNDWEGKSKNGASLPEDTYYYVLKVKDIYNDGKQRVYKGFVVIKR